MAMNQNAGDKPSDSEEKNGDATEGSADKNQKVAELCTAEDEKPANKEDVLTAGCNILSNRVLDEVLNEKKLALMRSPEVVKFLQAAQLKK